MKSGTTKGAKEARWSRSGEEDPMKLLNAGSFGEGGLQRCASLGATSAGRAGSKEEEGQLVRCGSLSAKDAAAAATGSKAGKGRPAKKRSTKRKAAAGSSEGEKADAAASAEAEGGVAEGEKLAADVTPAASTEADTGVKEVGLRLSEEYVDDILAWKPEVIEDPDEYYARMTNDPDNCFSPEFIEKSTEIQRDLAELCKRTAASFEKFQAWARSEFDEKGYVEVDDDYIAQRVLFRRVMEEENEVWRAAFGPMKEEDEEDGGGAVDKQGVAVN